MRASRGGKGSDLSRFPMAVMRPAASSASSSVSSSRPAAMAAAGGGSSQDSESGSAVPHSAQSSSKPARSAERISGSAYAGRLCVCGSSHSRMQTPGSVRPGAAPALIGGGTGHAHGLKPRHAHIRLEPRNSRQTAVNDHAHALDGDRRLGDGGREHHLALALGRRPQRKILRLHVHRAVKRGQHGRWIADTLLQPFLHAPDLALARQERQDRTGFRAQGTHDRVRHPVLDARARVAAEVARLDRERAAFAGDDGSIAQKPRHPRAIQRRRHRQDAQVLPQPGLAVERQGKPQIGIERALVELVEQHRADAGKLGIVKDHAGKDALGDDLDARPRPRFRDHPRAQADPLPDGLGQGVRHALRGCPRGNAARFQHQDLGGAEPAFVHQREGHARRLASARRGHEHGRCARGQGVAQFVQGGVNRERCGKLHGGCIQRSRPYRKHDLRRLSNRRHRSPSLQRRAKRRPEAIQTQVSDVAMDRPGGFAASR